MANLSKAPKISRPTESHDSTLVLKKSIQCFIKMEVLGGKFQFPLRILFGYIISNIKMMMMTTVIIVRESEFVYILAFFKICLQKPQGKKLDASPVGLY